MQLLLIESFDKYQENNFDIFYLEIWTCFTFFALFVFRFNKLLFSARTTKKLLEFSQYYGTAMVDTMMVTMTTTVAGVQAILQHCYGGYGEHYEY